MEVLDPSGRLFGHRIISQGAAGDGVQQDLTKRLMQVWCLSPLVLPWESVDSVSICKKHL